MKFSAAYRQMHQGMPSRDTLMKCHRGAGDRKTAVCFASSLKVPCRQKWPPFSGVSSSPSRGRKPLPKCFQCSQHNEPVNFPQELVSGR